MRVPKDSGKGKAGPADVEKKRITLGTIYKALNKYPKAHGASLRDIQRFIAKDPNVQSSPSSVKALIHKGIKQGQIKAPRGFTGFRGQPPLKTKKGKPGRRGRPAASQKPGRNNNADQSDNYGQDDEENKTASFWSTAYSYGSGCSIQ